jgi:hypothetical protein
MPTNIDFIILPVLFVLSNIYWAVIVHAMTNKLMSRSYYEYQQGKTLTEKKEPLVKIPVNEEGKIDDIGILGGFNF